MAPGDPGGGSRPSHSRYACRNNQLSANKWQVVVVKEMQPIMSGAPVQSAAVGVVCDTCQARM